MQPRAPEKGVFPLDHFGECKQVKQVIRCNPETELDPALIALQISQQYLACLKENAGEASRCRELSKLYLQCRMERSAAVPVLMFW